MEIERTFASVVKTGFEPGRVEGAIHQLELGIRHVRNDFLHLFFYYC
jgi:Zn-dependent M16 (insulinase) family peptidase